MMKKCYLLFLFFLTFQETYAFKLTRVILATDANPDYIQFWPISARAWSEIVGVRPTLALIADEDVVVDERWGDVIRFKPIPGIPPSFYAQCIRLFLPCLFPDDFCIVSDIDLLPLQRKFFTKYVNTVPEDCFVIYRDHYYWWWKERIYMNYNAAKGSTFREIFHVQTIDDIPVMIKAWHSLGIGWATDEKMLYKYVTSWAKENKGRLKKLGFWPHRSRRISRKEDCKYTKSRLKKGKYIELNCPRPYEKYKVKIDEIMQLAFLAAEIKRR